VPEFFHIHCTRARDGPWSTAQPAGRRNRNPKRSIRVSWCTVVSGFVLRHIGSRNSLRRYECTRSNVSFGFLLVSNVGSTPTAPTTFLIHFTGLAKTARQQKAALRAGQRRRASRTGGTDGKPTQS